MTTALTLTGLLAWFAAGAGVAFTLLIGGVAVADFCWEAVTGRPLLARGPWIGGRS